MYYIFMAKCSEQALQNAIQDAVNGSSRMKAAGRWGGVPWSTLQGRSKGITSRKEALEPRQRLSASQKSHHVSWILIQDAIGNPSIQEQVRKIASSLCHRNGDHRDVGKNWLQGFLSRNATVKTSRGKCLVFFFFSV